MSSNKFSKEVEYEVKNYFAFRVRPTGNRQFTMELLAQWKDDRYTNQWIPLEDADQWQSARIVHQVALLAKNYGESIGRLFSGRLSANSNKCLEMHVNGNMSMVRVTPAGVTFEGAALLPGGFDDEFAEGTSKHPDDVASIRWDEKDNANVPVREGTPWMEVSCIKPATSAKSRPLQLESTDFEPTTKIADDTPTPESAEEQALQHDHLLADDLQEEMQNRQTAMKRKMKRRSSGSFCKRVKRWKAPNDAPDLSFFKKLMTVSDWNSSCVCQDCTRESQDIDRSLSELRKAHPHISESTTDFVKRHFYSLLAGDHRRGLIAYFYNVHCFFCPTGSKRRQIDTLDELCRVCLNCSQAVQCLKAFDKFESSSTGLHEKVFKHLHKVSIPTTHEIAD